MSQVVTAELVTDVIAKLRARPVPVGISNRHVHITEQDFNLLFPGQTLTEVKALYQPGHYAAEQAVDLVGPKGTIKNVRILGPYRKQSQVEISATNARELGVKAPIRNSGDLAGTPGIKLVSPYGEVTLSEGVIIAQRHIHMSPLDAAVFNVKNEQNVSVAVGNEPRRVILNDVSVRVDPSVILEMHLDTDEANCAGLTGRGDVATIISAA